MQTFLMIEIPVYSPLKLCVLHLVLLYEINYYVLVCRQVVLDSTRPNWVQLLDSTFLSHYSTNLDHGV
jgi:hypothetical protein